MIDILWALYLATMIYFTYLAIGNGVMFAITREFQGKLSIVLDIIVCIMWAIWYMYFLH